MVNNKISFLFVLIISFNFFIQIISHEVSEEEIAKTIDEKIITCGSVLRIQNQMTKFK
jgi:hypothetical protein